MSIEIISSRIMNCDVMMIDEHRPTCVGLIKCIRDWKSYFSFPDDEDGAKIGDVHYGKNVSKGVFKYWQPQKLLFVSNEPIKVGDLYLDDANQIRQSFVDIEIYWSSRKNYRKIEAQSGEGPYQIPEEWICDVFVPNHQKISNVDVSLYNVPRRYVTILETENINN